eukprot:TRINITY_DN62701_c0_g1_i1.p1 TRINITY_DN62701_c0_g1~~TRINITY_DN62701_c0_g1_i1.p1  ORF type:complete len:284 (+),score=69.50 TRINITY_DN62701_c0_g1_i1:96-854(+)
MKNTFTVAAAALAAIFGFAGSASAQQDFVQVYEGFYAGAHLDMTLFGTDNSDLNNQFNSNAPELSLLMANGGIMFGYNREMSGGLIIGGEFDYTSEMMIDEFVNSNEAETTGTQVTNSIDGLMTIKARAGTQQGNTLMYVMGGYAFGTGNFETYSVNTSDDGAGPEDNCENSTCARSTEDLQGVAIGAGVEWAFRENWIARLEVQHTTFQNVIAPVERGDSEGACASGSSDLCSVFYRPSATAAKIGIVYRF